MTRRLYDPQIPPEREVLKEKRSLLAAMRGTDRVTRMGEQYLCTAEDGSMLVTSDGGQVTVFRRDHFSESGY